MQTNTLPIKYERKQKGAIQVREESLARRLVSHTVMRPTFASVVRLANHLPKWSVIQKDDPVAKIHAKFWGKPMVDEELEWRNSLGSERVNVDDVDDDIIPGCYILDFKIDGLDHPKIWVRADYIRAYNFLETHENSGGSVNHRAPAGILTGLPGIGKSVWVFYALRRRLGEGKPVIWYRASTCYLFVEEGVFSLNASPNFPSPDFHTFVWTLVDSDEANDGVPPCFVPHGTRLYVIYSTSPRKERWSRLHKTVRPVTLIMNPWSRKEISYASLIHGSGISDQEYIDNLYYELGPTPRLCVEYLSAPHILADYRRDLELVLVNMTLDQLEQLAWNASSLTLDAISHKICLIIREDREDVASRWIVKPITPVIQSKLACQLRKAERGDQVRLYEQLVRVPASRGLAGIVFEAAAQGRLQDGLDLELLPMFHLPSSREDSLPRWYSSHVLLLNQSLETCRQQALGEGHRIQVRPSLVIEYTDDGLPSIVPDVLYVPDIGNQVAFDSFMLLNGLLYLFQITTNEIHLVKAGLQHFFATRDDVPPMQDWRFVFIIPPDLTLVCPQPRLLALRELLLQTAVVTL